MFWPKKHFVLGAIFVMALVVSFLTVTGTATAQPQFKSHADYGTGVQPWAVAIRDLNQDGLPDMVVANSGSNSVSVLISDGVGGFQMKSEYTTGSSPIDVALRDLNHDGNLDLVALNGSSNTVTVLLGNGTGDFGMMHNFPTGNQPLEIAIGDLNQDGWLDLAVANSLDNSVSVLLGDGAGGFGDKTDFTVGTFPYSVSIGDLNQDGRPDLATPNESADSISVLFGDGAGGFGTRIDLAAGKWPACNVAIGDLNRDGNPDLAVPDYGSDSVSVFFGDGQGNFSPRADFAVGRGPVAVAIGDLNGDARPDLVVSNAGPDAGPRGNTISVLLGNSTGGFDPKVDCIIGAWPRRLAIGDLNCDGRLDIAVTNLADNTVSVLYNDTPSLQAPAIGVWSELNPGDDLPDGRHVQSAVYDSKRNRMIVFGGSNGTTTVYNDVWALSLSGTPKWSQIIPSVEGPSVRYSQAAIYDPVRDRMVIFGGINLDVMNDVWALSLSGTPKWSNITPSGTSSPGARAYHSAIYDPVSDQLVIFGGAGGNPGYGPMYNDVWALSLSGTPEWSNITPSVAGPSARGGQTAIYDAVRGRMVVFGGEAGAYGPVYNDVWALSLSGTPEWNDITPCMVGPSTRYGHTAIYDAVRDRMVVFGGNQTALTAELLDDVWALSLSPAPKWTNINPGAPGPTARYWQTAIDDSIRDRMVMFGGYAAPIYSNELWTLSWKSWTLSTTVAGSGNVARTPDLPSYNDGAVVTLTATPASGWQFTGWTGDVSGVTNPVTLTMDSNKSVTATFCRNVGMNVIPPIVLLWDYPLLKTVLASITPPPPFTAADINVSSLRLNGLPALKIPAPLSLLRGKVLVVAFNRKDFIGTLVPGNHVPVTLTGMMASSCISGKDYVIAYALGKECPINEAAYVASYDSLVKSQTVEEGPVNFALESVHPNPVTSRGLVVTFSLPTTAPAKLELFDVSGRCLFSQDAGSLGPGMHTTALSNLRISNGLYVIRLTQGANHTTKRVVVIN